MHKITTAIGLDFGTTKIGVAVGQTITSTANPVEIVKAKEGIPDWVTLDKIFARYNPQAIVVGIPYEKDENIGEMAKKANKFANRVKERYKIELFKIDETYTSKLADSTIQENKHLFNKKNTQKNDSIAAAIFLQEWLINYSNKYI